MVDLEAPQVLLRCHAGVFPEKARQVAGVDMARLGNLRDTPQLLKISLPLTTNTTRNQSSRARRPQKRLDRRS